MSNAYVRPNVASSGVTFANLQAIGLVGHLEKLIAAQPQPGSPNSAPTSAPTSATNANVLSTLPTATYYSCQTETNGFGETTAGPVTSGTLVTSGTNNLRLTTTASLKSGNTAANLYISAVGNTGPWQLAAAGIAANTAVDISAPIANSWSTVQPPTANTTALSTKQIELIRAVEKGNLQDVVRHAHDIVANFLQGQAVPYSSAIKHFEEADAAISLLYKLFGEIGTLIVANPGTFQLANTGIGGSKTVRTWP